VPNTAKRDRGGEEFIPYVQRTLGEGRRGRRPIPARCMLVGKGGGESLVVWWVGTFGDGTFVWEG